MTLNQVTQFIRHATKDDKVSLIRGKGYFYFSGGKADSFHQQGVYVNTLHSLTKQEWLKEYLARLPA